MPRAGLNREAVVNEAVRAADEMGYEGLTLASIARRLRVAEPSLYKHIESLADLRRAVAVVAVTELATTLKTALAVPGRRAALGALSVAYREYAHAHPGRYAATLRAPADGDLELAAAAEAALRPVLQVLARYELTGDDAIDATRTLRAALHGFVALEAQGGFGLPQAVDRSFVRLVDGLDTLSAQWVGPTRGADAIDPDAPGGALG